MPLNETSDGDINLLWHSTVSTVNNERNFNFCAISFVHYMGENIPLNILVEVRNISFCNSTYQMPTLGRNPTIIGLLVCSVYLKYICFSLLGLILFSFL